MSRSAVRRLAGLVALVIAVALPRGAFAGPGTEPFIERLLDTGIPAFSLGVGEPSFRWDLGSLAPTNPGARASERLPSLDADTRGRAVSFDLRLRWPGAETTSVEPYLAVGPALLLSEPDSIAALAGTRADPTVRLGARLGAGLSWRLGKDTTLFGGYELTTASPNGRLTVGPKPAGDAVGTGYDLTYGVRFRY